MGTVENSTVRFGFRFCFYGSVLSRFPKRFINDISWIRNYAMECVAELAWTCKFLYTSSLASFSMLRRLLRIVKVAREQEAPFIVTLKWLFDRRTWQTLWGQQEVGTDRFITPPACIENKPHGVRSGFRPVNRISHVDRSPVPIPNPDVTVPLFTCNWINKKKIKNKEMFPWTCRHFIGYPTGYRIISFLEIFIPDSYCMCVTIPVPEPATISLGTLTGYRIISFLEISIPDSYCMCVTFHWVPYGVPYHFVLRDIHPWLLLHVCHYSSTWTCHHFIGYPYRVPYHFVLRDIHPWLLLHVCHYSSTWTCHHFIGYPYRVPYHFVLRDIHPWLLLHVCHISLGTLRGTVSFRS